ncbi:MAG TPA: hemolysin family protein [Vicinamibacterales bacterium]|nr:hemolysin family protein [Vicinamibacterales bacterium]
MIVPLAIIALLILLNALFVAAEFAIVGAPRTAIDARASRGDRLARGVQAILHDARRQDRYIATAQIGVTVASLGLGMYGEHVIAEWVLADLPNSGTAAWLAAHGMAGILAVAILTYFHIVLGEMVPKSLALQRAEHLALWITPPMRWIQTALLPLVVSLNAIGNMVLRAIGIDRRLRSVDQYYTPEELLLVVEESEQLGALRAESGQMLQDLFEFGDLTAGEAMVPRVRITGIPAGAAPDDLRTIIERSPHTRYPVYEGDLDHIAGMVHIKDLLQLLLNAQPVSTEHTRPAPVVPDTALLDAVLATMRRERAQMAIVIDEHGGTAGILTLEDLFEEVVGEFDEGRGAPRAVRDAAGRLLVPGTLRVDELGELFDLELSHEEVDSVSGLVLMLLGRPPAVGDRVQFGRLRLEVTAVAGHGVAEAAVGLSPEAELPKA